MMLAFVSALLLVASQDAAEGAEPVAETAVVEAAEATEVAAAAAEETAEARPAPVEDDVICRRKFSSGNKFGDRTASSKVCKTREEWENDRRKRR